MDIERNRLAHPLRRSLLLAALMVAPIATGALLLGADPMPLFVGGLVVSVAGALLFGSGVRWLPPLAFAGVMVPSVVAAVPVFGGLVAVILSLAYGAIAAALFYRPTPPEPPRSRTSTYARRDGPSPVAPTVPRRDGRPR